MKILNNVRHRHAICLKFGGRFFYFSDHVGPDFGRTIRTWYW